MDLDLNFGVTSIGTQCITAEHRLQPNTFWDRCDGNGDAD